MSFVMANLERCSRRFSASSPPSRPPQTSPSQALAISYMGGGPITGRVLRKHALHRITEEHKQEICMAFQLFDFRKVGKLNDRELKLAMRALQFDVKKAEVKMLLDKFAKECEDEVNYEEFMEISSD